MRAWLLTFGSACLAFSAHASLIKSIDYSIHDQYVSTRALGMGNAFTAVADDYSAIFYNPAVLALRTDGQLRMFVRAAADAEVFGLKNQLQDVKNQPRDQQATAYGSLIEEHYGDHFFARAPTIGAAWVRPGWGIAFIPADLSVDIDDERIFGASLNVNTYLDSTLAFSYAHSLSDSFSVGATLKGIHRVYVGKQITAGDLFEGNSVFSTSDANEGVTADVDIGTYWSPEVAASGFFHFLKYMRPHFALVGRNLIDYGFKWNPHLIKKSGDDPPNLGRRADFGTKFDLPRFWVFDPHLSADMRDVGDANWTFRKGSHVGMEFYWKVYNWWKGHWSAGLNQGYWTAGFGARLAWFQIDLASYGEEVGTGAAPKEDRRYMAELALDF
jgi:hypothetical protein